MNTFGTIFRMHIFGESHGPAVGIIIDGCPTGMDIHADMFTTDLERRKGGILKGTTPRSEPDVPIFLSGVFNNKTTGAPLTIIFENTNTRSKDYEMQREIPRPGHADFVAQKKYKGMQDYRGGGHFSGRLTVALVAAGVIAKKILAKRNIICSSNIIEIGGETDMDKGLQKAIDAKDSVGGIITCHITGLPIGLGEPFFNSVESLISHLVFSIPAIKGIEFGAGFSAAKMFGSEHNDALENKEGKTTSNHAGGIVGGITNGNEVNFKVVVKPTSSTPKKQTSLNVVTNKPEEFSIKGRHDLCIALRVPVVLEAVAACVMADLLFLNDQQLNY
ncbi:MAG: chorismate synthase [Niastella sp.]|nr:chorismate synthase [Niastella sp.]